MLTICFSTAHHEEPLFFRPPVCPMRSERGNRGGEGPASSRSRNCVCFACRQVSPVLQVSFWRRPGSFFLFLFLCFRVVGVPYDAQLVSVQHDTYLAPFPSENKNRSPKHVSLVADVKTLSPTTSSPPRSSSAPAAKSRTACRGRGIGGSGRKGTKCRFDGLVGGKSAIFSAPARCSRPWILSRPSRRFEAHGLRRAVLSARGLSWLAEASRFARRMGSREFPSQNPVVRSGSVDNLSLPPWRSRGDDFGTVLYMLMQRNTHGGWLIQARPLAAQRMCRRLAKSVERQARAEREVEEEFLRRMPRDTRHAAVLRQRVGQVRSVNEVTRFFLNPRRNTPSQFLPLEKTRWKLPLGSCFRWFRISRQINDCNDGAREWL